MSNSNIRIAIVDYGLGNLFSVKHACNAIGLETLITSQKDQILAADGVILPGVGAFGDAMDTLLRFDLVSPLRDIASARKPLLGICLGQQLLMSESYEFGHHLGLNIIPGTVVRFDNLVNTPRRLKVPQVGWNHIFRPQSPQDPWAESILTDLQDGEYMYFVHSFYTKPASSDAILSTSRYGEFEFCSSLQSGNISACQFHPERSGRRGLQIYKNWATLIRQWKQSNEEAYV